MDKLPVDTKHILANDKGQPLSQHLFAVGYLAYCILDKIGIDKEQKNLRKCCFLIGMTHDIGKIDPQFQKYIKTKFDKATKTEIEPPIPEDGHHVEKSKKFLEDNPRHNEISVVLFQKLFSYDAIKKYVNSSLYESVRHGIYWHHSKVYRVKDKFKDAEAIYRKFEQGLPHKDYNRFHEKVVAVLNEAVSISKEYWDMSFPGIESRNDKETRWEPLPKYKNYRNDIKLDEYNKYVRKNAYDDIIRSAFISADRIVSDMSAKDLEKYLTEGSLANALDKVMLDESNLSVEIDKCLAKFLSNPDNNERNQEQSKAANELAKLKEIAEFDELANIGVLQGPAGCGKTKIALEWALETKAKQIIWVCPRIQVCLGLLNDLTQADYLPNAKIEILTGEHKKILTGGISLKDAAETPTDDYFSGDIVITTIDQVINNIISHSKVTAMVNFMQAHVVFDEFHELIPMPAFNLLFAELIEAKKLRQHQANTLLVSATPHDLFVTELLNLPPENIVRIDSFNQSRYCIKFESYDDKEQANPLITTPYTDGKKTFVITNTAQDAQQAFIYHQADENNVLLHSKYTKDDKTKWFNKVFECFKQDGDGGYDVLRSGPIVQASLNISCDRMITELTNAENWLQRLGRLDRFGVNDEVNIYTTVIPQSSESGKQTNSTAKFLANLCSWQSTVAWLDFLKDKLSDKDEVTLNELYAIYQDFYSDGNSQEKISQDIQSALQKSVQLINSKVTDPISFPPKSKQKDKVMKIAKNSLRGDNRFVQMAVCEVGDDLQPTFIDEYAYDENADLTQEVGLTESVDRITGYDDSDKNLLAFMKAKHHNIKDNTKKAYKDFMLLSEARSPENPIYLSYTSKDLEPIGGEKQRHKHAIYYVKTDKQPVGAMQIIKLTNPVKD